MAGDTSGDSSEMEKWIHFFVELVFWGTGCAHIPAVHPLNKQRIEMQKMMSSKYDALRRCDEVHGRLSG